MAIKRHVVSYKDNELEQWLAKKVEESSTSISTFYKDLALREFRKEKEQDREQEEQAKEEPKPNYIDNFDIVL